MFEHIYFFTHQTDGENQDVLKDEAYQKASMIKDADPELSTYVTFTSPFWRLRVGDFRSFEEANLKLIE